ncbi:hypothetical protein HOY82DRAFT_673422 [Tuber indicum]|nr:hypothetical protein HOY82DRAFT_673422 [Tuber indicum]
MAIAIKVVGCVSSFSCPSLSPAATARGGLAAQLRRRLLSSSGKNGEAAIKAGVENRRIGASNFVKKTGLRPSEASVGNGLMVDVMMSFCTNVFTQTAIMDEGSRTIYLGLQSTNPTDPRALDAILQIYTILQKSSFMHLGGAYPKWNLFISGATGSNDMSIKFVPRLYRSRKHIITLKTEHKGVLYLCQHLKGEGYGTTYLHVANIGLIILERLKEIRPDSASFNRDGQQ